MRQWEGGGLLLVSPLGGWCVCECVVMDKAIDCGVWFLQQPVPTQGQRRTGREAQTAAVIDTSSQSDNALSAFHHVHLLSLQTNPTERVCVCVSCGEWHSCILITRELDSLVTGQLLL